VDGKLIAITGRAGSGKDFVGDLIINDAMRLGFTAVKVPWARGVRQDIENELGVGTIPRLYEKPTPPVIRKLLQWWGTDFRRGEDPDFWVKWGLASAEAALRWADVVLFPDTRFPNEADAIRAEGGIVVKVEASQETRRRRIGIVPEHESEMLIDSLPVDVVVENDSDRHLEVPTFVHSYMMMGET